MKIILSKKRLLIFSTGLFTVILITFFPILLNFGLLSWNSHHTHGNTEAWISFFASFYGAIIGGIVSGTITLYGVRYTILEQRNNEIIKSYPKKRKLGDDIQMTVLSSYRMAAKCQKSKNYLILNQYASDIYKSKDELLLKASEVSDEVYEEIRSVFIVDIRELSNIQIINKLNGDEESLDHYVKSFYKCSNNILSSLEEITIRYNGIKNRKFFQI
ncbi:MULTISPECIES: hypothetical protein [Bacillus]|nr:hypothetical protein [Bacillus velezensis]